MNPKKVTHCVVECIAREKQKRSLRVKRVACHTANKTRKHIQAIPASLARLLCKFQISSARRPAKRICQWKINEMRFQVSEESQLLLHRKMVQTVGIRMMMTGSAPDGPSWLDMAKDLPLPLKKKPDN